MAATVFHPGWVAIPVAALTMPISRIDTLARMYSICNFGGILLTRVFTGPCINLRIANPEYIHNHCAKALAQECVAMNWGLWT